MIDVNATHESICNGILRVSGDRMIKSREGLETISKFIQRAAAMIPKGHIVPYHISMVLDSIVRRIDDDLVLLFFIH